MTKKIMTKNAITDHLFNLRRENLHQGLGGKFPHRVVLDRTTRQVCNISFCDYKIILDVRWVYGIQLYQRRSWRQTRRWSWWSSACCPCSPGRRSAPSKCSTWLGQPEGDQYSSIPIMFGFFIKSELHQEYHRHHHLCHSQTHLSSPLQFVLALLYHSSKLTKSEIELRL